MDPFDFDNYPYSVLYKGSQSIIGGGAFYIYKEETVIGFGINDSGRQIFIQGGDGAAYSDPRLAQEDARLHAKVESAKGNPFLGRKRNWAVWDKTANELLGYFETESMVGIPSLYPSFFSFPEFLWDHERNLVAKADFSESKRVIHLVEESGAFTLAMEPESKRGGYESEIMTGRCRIEKTGDFKLPEQREKLLFIYLIFIALAIAEDDLVKFLGTPKNERDKSIDISHDLERQVVIPELGQFLGCAVIVILFILIMQLIL